MKILFFLYLLILPVSSIAQVVDQAYEFPIKPGTSEWANLLTEKDRFNAMQIPAETLSKMSDCAVVKSCINFPAFFHFTAYDDFQTGFIILATKFNGLKELPKRTGAANCLLEIYRNTGLENFEPTSMHLNEYSWEIRLIWIELILSQSKLISSLDIDKRIDLLTLTYNKLVLDLNSNKFTPATQTKALIMGRILKSLNDRNFELECSNDAALKSFIDTSKMSDAQSIDKILHLTVKYININ